MILSFLLKLNVFTLDQIEEIPDHSPSERENSMHLRTLIYGISQRKGAMLMVVIGALAMVNDTEAQVAKNTQKASPLGLQGLQGAIFQRGKPIPLDVKSRLKSGTKVIARLADVSATGVMGKKSLKMTLPAIEEYGGPHELTFTMENGDSFSADDIYIGDIWVCAGQSNMVFPMTTMHASQTYEPAKDDSYPLVRFKGNTRWKPATDISVIRRFAGTPYYFGRELHRQLKIPIGLRIVGSGGTSMWHWTPPSVHDQPEFSALKEVMLERIEQYKKFAEDNPKVREKDHMPSPAPGFAPQPYWLSGIARGSRSFGFLDQSDWLPNAACKGIVFWQGEADGGLAANYELLFGAMLKHWRSKTENQNYLPFIFIQLPSYAAGPVEEQYLRRPGFVGLRDAQRRVANRFDNVQMMVGLDIYGIKGDIHPSNKVGYGTRLAQTALGMVYGQDIPWRSPEYEHITIAGDTVTVHFRHAGKGLRSKHEHPAVREFLLAGKDGIFHPAQAIIASINTIEVRSNQVSKPVAVRYGWKESPHVDLVADGDLPASPFRSDDWELWDPAPKK